MSVDVHMPELEPAAVRAAVEHESDVGEESTVGGRAEDLVRGGQPVRAREPDVQRYPDLEVKVAGRLKPVLPDGKI